MQLPYISSLSCTIHCLPRTIRWLSCTPHCFPRTIRWFSCTPHCLPCTVLCLSGIPVVSVNGAAGGYEISESFKMDKEFATPGEYSLILTALRGLV